MKFWEYHYEKDSEHIQLIDNVSENVFKDFWALENFFKGRNTENTQFLKVFLQGKPYNPMSTGGNMFFLKDIFDINLLKS